MSEYQTRSQFDDALRGFYQDHDEVRPDENVDYRSLTAESVGSLILGFLSILTFVHPIFAVFPIIGIVLGVVAIRKILGASEVLGGIGISSSGVALCFLVGVSGICYQYYISSFSVPLGYVEIDFAMLAADPTTGRISPEVLALATRTDERGQIIPGPRVFIEGFMFPTRNMTAIDNFMLVPSLQHGPFGAVKRRETEMIDVKLSGGETVDYRTSPIRVGGLLSIKDDYKPGEVPYQINADIVR
ncbi:MAG: hypothetical protein ACRCUY_04375 [Thermoguttaceae bacterium]